MTDVNHDGSISELKEEIENTWRRFYKASDHVYSQASALRDKVASLRAARVDIGDLIKKGDTRWANELIHLLKDIDNAAKDVINAAKLSNFPADNLYRAISKTERSLSGSK